MSNLRKSKAIAWAAFALVLVVLVASFKLRMQWWEFIDIFFAFVATFSHIVALTIEKLNSRASRQLDTAAFLSLVLAIVAFIAQYIAGRILIG